MNIAADENIPLLDAFFSDQGIINCLPGREITAQTIGDAEALLVRSVTPVTKELLQNSQVRFVGTCTIGTDHLDLSYLQRQGIVWANAPGCNARGVVDYVLGCVLTLAEATAGDLSRRRYGIVGAGQVGGRLAEVLRQLGWSVKICDPPRKRREHRTDFVDIDEIIETCDVITLHTPLTREGVDATHHLFDERRLRALTPGTWLINAARGAIIDNSALHDRLHRNGDLHVALDVWENEPAVDVGLAQKCHLSTPHIAGYSLDGKWRGTAQIYEAFCQWRQLEPCIRLETLTPSPWLKQLWLDEHAEMSWALQTLCRSVYDPGRDDRAFRRTLHLPEQERLQAFDDLRKRYPYRREIPGLTIQLPEGADHLRRVAQAVGAQVNIIR